MHLKITKFLKPFREMTLQLEGHKLPTLHKVWPVFIKIQDLLKADVFACEESEHGYIVENMKVDGLNYLNSNWRDFEPTDIHKVATILHPLLKNLNRVSSDEKTRAYRVLDEIMRKIQPVPTAINRRRVSQNFNVGFLNEFCDESEKKSLIL